MKTKILTLVLLTLVLSVAMVCAADFSVSTTSPNSLSKSVNSTSFTITPSLGTSQAVNMVVTLPQQISDGTNTLTLNSPYTFTFNSFSNGQTTSPVLVSYNSANMPSTFMIGQFSANAIVNATDTSNSSNTYSTTVPITFRNDFCKSGENGTNLSIDSVSFSNQNGDDTTWKPLDNIKITVKVDNNGNNNVRKVYTVIGLVDSNGRDVINNMNNLANKKVSVGTINDGSEKTVTYTFQVPVDFKDVNYKFVVKAYSDDAGESNLCTASSSDLDNKYYQSISGQREDRSEYQVVVNNIQVAQSQVACGDKVQLTAEVYNIGNTDYTDQIKVNLYNKDLGLNQDQVIRTDLNQGDSTTADFEFDVPVNASEKTYTLTFRTYYDYNTGSNTYSETSANTFTTTIQVQGNCMPAQTSGSASTVRISADLDPSTPDVVPGKDVLVDAVVRNLGTAPMSLAVGVSGNSAWSTLKSVDPQQITLAPGATQTVTIKLNVDPDATGDQSFKITAASSTQTFDQTVNLAIAGAPAQSSNAVSQNLQDNWFIYLIILVNVILIIAIIMVIRRMMAPRREY